MSDATVNGVVYPLPGEPTGQKTPLYNEVIQALAAALLGTQTPARVRAYHSTTQSISNTTLTAVSLDSERYDTDTIHDTVTNNSRLTCKTAGAYAMVAQCGFAANATGSRVVAIRLNGSSYIAYIEVPACAGSRPTDITVSTQFPLAVNDYVEMMVWQNSGGSLNTDQAASYTPEFSMIRMGA